MGKRKAVFIGLAAVMVGAAALFCCIDRLTPKKFSAFFEGPPAACSVSQVNSGTIQLSREQCKELLSCLESAEFYCEGEAGRILSGRLYHVNLQGAESGAGAALEMVVSEEGPIYIGKKRYRVEGAGEPPAALLERFFN